MKVRNLFILLLLISITACKSLILFSLEDDRALGLQVSEQIESDPSSYPILDSATYSKSYAYLYEIRDEILKSGQVVHASDFAWKMKIIHNDSVLNAFCTPGGYIYVYTGLIKYLDSVDDLAGVMGHEIAHADLRHSSRQIQTQYGVAIISSILLGDSAGTIATITTQLAGGLAGLKFSRNHESEADNNSVTYLSKTKYKCNGAAGFFQKLEDEGSGSVSPEFLSTHPSSPNRIEKINDKADEMACNTIASNNASYQAFKNSLP